jgi:hypothetical protein
MACRVEKPMPQAWSPVNTAGEIRRIYFSPFLVNIVIKCDQNVENNTHYIREIREKKIVQLF